MVKRCPAYKYVSSCRLSMILVKNDRQKLTDLFGKKLEEEKIYNQNNIEQLTDPTEQTLLDWMQCYNSTMNRLFSKFIRSDLIEDLRQS